MASDDPVSAMEEALLEAGKLVKAHGSPALQSAMRLVLFTLGREIAQRDARRTHEGGREAGSGDSSARIIGKRPG